MEQTDKQWNRQGRYLVVVLPYPSICSGHRDLALREGTACATRGGSSSNSNNSNSNNSNSIGNRQQQQQHEAIFGALVRLACAPSTIRKRQICLDTRSVKKGRVHCWSALLRYARAWLVDYRFSLGDGAGGGAPSIVDKRISPSIGCTPLP